MSAESRWRTTFDRSTAGWRLRLGLRAGTDYSGTETRIRAGSVLAAGDLWLVAASAVLANIRASSRFCTTGCAVPMRSDAVQGVLQALAKSSMVGDSVRSVIALDVRAR